MTIFFQVNTCKYILFCKIKALKVGLIKVNFFKNLNSLFLNLESEYCNLLCKNGEFKIGEMFVALICVFLSIKMHRVITKYPNSLVAATEFQQLESDTGFIWKY